jgi:hypothetical protein
MLAPSVIESNKATWLGLLDRLDLFPGDPRWTPIRPVIQAGVDGGLHQYFRAGISMEFVVLSTCERHGIETYNPRPPTVTLRAAMATGHDKDGMLVGWVNPHPELEREVAVNTGSVTSVLHHYLADLWRETRPTESVPSVVEPDTPVGV